MSDSKIEGIFSGMNPEEQKSMLGNLVSALTGGLSQESRQDMLKMLLSGKKDSQHLESMVEF